RAARILLRMPPVPSALFEPPAMSITLPSISGTVANNSALGFVAGSLAYRPSTLVSSTSSGACSRLVTIAARWSVSPKLISRELAQVGGAFAQPQAPDTGADGPGADQGHLAAGLADALHLVGQRLQALGRQPAVGAGQHVGADLDDDGVSQGDHFLPDRIEHRIDPRRDTKEHEEKATSSLLLLSVLLFSFVFLRFPSCPFVDPSGGAA